MGMPNTLLLIRHGKSEANIIQEADDLGKTTDYPPEIVKAIRERPDWQQRLCAEGIRQARTAGQWLSENGYSFHTFDAVYSSFYVRARETAHNIDPSYDHLRPHSTIHEQDWGVYGELTPEEQQEMFARTYRLHKESPMFARFDNGESPLDMIMRLRDWRNTLYKKWDSKRVAAIMHGGTILGAQAIIERWLPEDFARIKDGGTRKVRNCSLTFYSRENPFEAGDVRDHPNWRRMIYPTAPAESPDNGEWVELEDRRFLGSAALLSSIEAIPRLFPEMEA